MEVRDGAFKTSDLIGRYCGTEKPESITSDSWDMRVTFKSSGKTSYPGFKASYKRKSKYGRFRVTGEYAQELGTAGREGYLFQASGI